MQLVRYRDGNMSAGWDRMGNRTMADRSANGSSSEQATARAADWDTVEIDRFNKRPGDTLRIE